MNIPGHVSHIISYKDPLVHIYIITSLGTPIATLTAYDGDRSGNVSFSIADSNFAGGIVVLVNKTSMNHFYSVNLWVGPNVTDSTFDYDVSTADDY